MVKAAVAEPRFLTQYDKYRVSSRAGSKMEPVYTSAYDDKGVIVLEVVGERDVYADIQVHKDSVDINKILKRFANGETDVLSKVQGFYEDVTEMPKTYQEVLNTVIMSEEFFDSLPVEIKKDFDNSFSEFLVATEDPEFLTRFSKDRKNDDVVVDDPKPIEEVPANE